MSPYCCEYRGLSVLGAEDARVNATLFSFLGKPVGNEIQGQLRSRNAHTPPGTSANIEGSVLYLNNGSYNSAYPQNGRQHSKHCIFLFQPYKPIL